MKFSIALIVVAGFVSAVFSQQPLNQFKSATASDICKNAKLKANGTQIRSGFCSSTIQGQIPDTNNMVASEILFPQNEGTIPQKKNFTARVKVTNLVTGFFSDAVNDYYDKPQELQGGKIKGHSHITIQRVGQLQDPTIFAFFKGLNLAAKNGILTQVVGSDKADGLPRGRYRMCVMNSAFTHQPVVMPVAQRGAQDDCIRFNVK